MESERGPDVLEKNQFIIQDTDTTDDESVHSEQEQEKQDQSAPASATSVKHVTVHAVILTNGRRYTVDVKPFVPSTDITDADRAANEEEDQLAEEPVDNPSEHYRPPADEYPVYVGTVHAQFVPDYNNNIINVADIGQQQLSVPFPANYPQMTQPWQECDRRNQRFGSRRRRRRQQFNDDPHRVHVQRGYHGASHDHQLSPQFHSSSDYRKVCVYCRLACFSKFEWDRHIEIHNRERGLWCQVCGIGFLRKYQLETHMEQHEREYQGPW